LKLKRIVLLLFILFIAGEFLCAKYHPGINWKEISRGRFTVIYPAGFNAEADYALQSAEELYLIIKDFWESNINGRVRILLHDSSDYFSEESTFFPYNRICISMYPPDPHSLFGNYTDHIRDVIRHGLNRIFVYNQGSSFLRFFRKYFGSNSVFFPTIFIPGWTLAGVSAYEEINSDSDTRFHSPEFDLILNKIAAEKKFPPPGSLKSRSSNWPGPFSQNVFGAGLIKFLSETEKKDKIREFVRHYTSHPFPVGFKGLFKPRFFSMSERYRMVFGKDMSESWKELENKLVKMDAGSVKQKKLTNSGFVKKFPVRIADGSVVFFRDNFKSYPGIYILRKSAVKPELLIRKKVVSGISYFKKGDILYFSAVETYRKYFNFADIYSYDMKKKKLSRITKGGRLTYPIRSGQRIYCIKRETTGSYISYFSIDDHKVKKISDKFMFLSGLSISPGSGYMAASVKTGIGNWKIGVFNMDGVMKGLVEYGGERAFSPIWKNDKELMFVTSLDKKFGLASFNINLGEMRLYDSVSLPSFKYFDTAPGNRIIVPALTGDGYDLVMVDLSKISPETGTYAFEAMGVEKDKKIRSHPVEKKYTEFRDFTPKYFTLSFREGGNELQAGILASGFDTLNENYFKIIHMTGLLSGRSNIYLNYVYKGLPGEFGLKFSKFSDMNRSDDRGEFFHVSQDLIAYYRFPLSLTLNGDLSVYTDIHFEKREDEFRDQFESNKTVHNGIRAGLTIKSTELYYNSISENDGFNFNAVYSRDLKFFGSPAGSNLLTIEYSQFIPVSGVNTMAMRFAFAHSWGDSMRAFYMGGFSAEEELSYSGDKLFGLVRGFPSGYFSGNRGFSLNLEYRMLLKRVERSFLIFKSVESIYASLFFDSGQLWSEKMDFDPIISAGGELNIVLYLGSIRYVVAGGIGYAITPEKKPAFYFRLGSSF